MGKAKRTDVVSVEQITQSILVFRGHKVLLDEDLAILYGVVTGALVSPLTLAVSTTVAAPIDAKLCVTVVPLTPLSVWSTTPSPFQSSW